MCHAITISKQHLENQNLFQNQKLQFTLYKILDTSYSVFHRNRQAKFAYGNFEFKPIFATVPAAFINDACCKSSQNWLGNNHLLPWSKSVKQTALHAMSKTLLFLGSIDIKSVTWYLCLSKSFVFLSLGMLLYTFKVEHSFKTCEFRNFL